MVTAFCMNPCIDKTVEIDKFTYGGMNRILAIREDPSGKGVNVAIMAARLGMRSRVAGFLYERGGELIANRMAAEGVENACVRLSGAVRVNTKLLDRSNRVITEINEPGVPATADDVRALSRDAERFSSDVLVFTGSLPPGCASDTYAELIAAAKAANPNVFCVVDAEGEKLMRGVEAGPSLIKPNQYELELAVGRKLGSVVEIKEAALELCGRGVRFAAVSMGGNGALLTDGSRTCFAPALPITVVSTLGAGDSMVAGMIHAIEQNLTLDGILRWGVAAATAAVMLAGTEFPTRAQVLDMHARVNIRDI